MNKIEELNRKFEFQSVGVFPFINPKGKEYTVLRAGLYKKHKANYRGVSYVYDNSYGKYKAMLLGYYYVPENFIVVPETMEVDDIKEGFIKAFEDDNFKRVNRCPSLKAVEFDEGSEEYLIAKETFDNFKKEEEYDTLSN